MKRIIAAVAFAALAVPAAGFAADTGAPYEKDQFDRILPSVQNPAVTDSARASAGATSAPSGAWATGVWARDHNFVSPAE